VPQKEAYTLKTLDQMKVLADPLRIRVLEALCQERTTKQVAELLGEKPTKLYHHVEALEKVGLIALSRTRQNRGTVEKYYLAVARTFRADSRVFQPKRKGGSEKSASIQQMISNIFDTTSSEIASLLDPAQGAMNAMKEEGIVSFLEIRASEAQLNEIRRKLNEAIQSATADDVGAVGEASDAESEDAPKPRRYRLTLAYYPLDRGKQRPRRKK
jgi:DNA-binding transcriptional ArsR family regulator